jgi:plastocyanin
MKAFAFVSAVCVVGVGLVFSVGTAARAQVGPCQAGDILVSAVDSSFSAQTKDVLSGETVCWTNDGALSHDVTSDAPGAFSSGNLPSDQSFRHTFPSAGNYPYYCSLHGGRGGVGMAGTITVGSSSPLPPPPPGPPPPGPPPPGPPPPPSPPPASPPPPPPSVPPPPQRLQVSSVRISVGRRAVVARARISRAALARLSLLRGRTTRRSVRRQWRPGANSIRVLIPARARGRWTAELRIGTLRFRRTIRFG